MPTYESEQNAINRKRALAQALQQQAFTPIDMPQVAGANVHATQGLAPIAQALFAGLINRKLDKKQGKLDTEREADRQARLQALAAALAPPDQAPQLAQALGSEFGSAYLSNALAMRRDKAQDESAMARVLAGKSEPAVPAGFTLAPGQSRFDAQGNPIAALPAAPSAAAGFTMSPGQTRFDAQGNPIAALPAGEASRPASLQEYDAWVAQQKPGTDTSIKAYWKERDSVTSPARPLAPIVIQTPAGPQIVDRGSGTARPIQDASGTVGLTPTAQERNFKASLGRIDPILDGISALSEKINTQQGVIAKISGEAEKAKATVNLNDDVSEYQSLIAGFTPMIARAVGHTGVLTQQDVDSVRELFPKPGDSKSLRDRKIARVKTILGAVGEAMGGAPAPSDIPEYERGPDGKLRLKQ